MHRKRLTDPFLTWTVGQREEGRRDAKRKRGVDRGEHGGEAGKGQTGGRRGRSDEERAYRTEVKERQCGRLNGGKERRGARG